MSEKERGLYDEGWRYDLVLGEYAPSEMLDFYRRQIARAGEPVLELACGQSRRLACGWRGWSGALRGSGYSQ